MRGKDVKKDNKKSKAKKVLNRPQPIGWASTDEDEIVRRRLRGQVEITKIEALEREHPVFGTFRVASASGGSYEVEIRDLKGRTNSCNCPDYQVNGLGTCKHIEGVLAALKKRKAALFRKAAKTGSPRIEIFLNRSGGQAAPMIRWPQDAHLNIETAGARLTSSATRALRPTCAMNASKGGPSG